MIKRIKELLNEISVLDIYPKQFKSFIDKYKSHINDDSLFVNFSSFKTDPLDKRFASSQGFHRDPEGLYVYPLEYVINHPADLKFGENRENLVVVKSKAKNVLDLQNISKEEAKKDLEKLKVIVSEEEYKKLPALLKNKTRTHYWFDELIRTGKKPGYLVYFYARNILDESSNEHLLEGREQSNRFKSLGYDFILDNSKTGKQAIIHENEPEQGIFLTRNAFEVIETFQLRKEKIDNWGGSVANYLDLMSKKIFGLFAQKFNTGIRYIQKAGYFGEIRAVLNNGIEIVLEVTPEESFGKSHREVRDELRLRTKVTLKGKAYFQRTFFPYDSLDDLINKSVEGYYDKIKENK